jgi:hypothetical protein
MLTRSLHQGAGQTFQLLVHVYYLATSSRRLIVTETSTTSSVSRRPCASLTGEVARDDFMQGLNGITHSPVVVVDTPSTFSTLSFRSVSL